SGRQVTVMETPDWLHTGLSEGNRRWDVGFCVNLSAPRPHTFLLVTPLGCSTGEERRTLQTVLEIFGERALGHAMILFTHADELTSRTLEELVHTEDELTETIRQKCGNRYHVLNNKNRGDRTQVTELLEKIEDMVAGKSDCYYETEEMNLQKVAENFKTLGIKERQRIQELLQKTLGPQLLPKSEFMLYYVYQGEVWEQVSCSQQQEQGRPHSGPEECVKSQGEVAGRQITVVDTPGWYFSSEDDDTLEWIRKVIEPSVSLCPPGPHALLLVINLDSVKEKRSVEKHLELLSKRAWRHTIVLFTWGDTLRHTTIEQHIERGGKELQWLGEKCGNRYHVLNNKNRDDHTQVTELLEKIEDMVAGKSDCYYEIEEMNLKEMEEKLWTLRIKKREKIEELLLKTLGPQLLPKREGQADSHEAPQRLSEIRIVLLGQRGSGKSSAGNAILGREEFEMWGGPQECVKRQCKVVGRQVTVVDTPDWYSSSVLFEEESPVEDTLNVSLCPPGPHALLVVINLDSYTDWRSVEKHLKLLSERVWRHTIVLFTWGDTLRHTTIEQHIERGGKELQWLVEKCGSRYHVLNNKNRDDRTQVTELLEKIDDMVAGNYGLCFTTDIKEINTELEKYIKQKEEKRQRETEELREREETRRRETEELRQREEERQRETEELRQRLKERQRETEELRQREE
uniref:AIG1-type G domain-containing protein n=1 Tax=Lepisosteus oculatus TaxID=7918 RepID=W5LVX8_LEPOC